MAQVPITNVAADPSLSRLATAIPAPGDAVSARVWHAAFGEEGAAA